jgi:hypothetical protein
MKRERRIPKKLARTSATSQKQVFESTVSRQSRTEWSEVLQRIHAAKERLDVRANEDWWYRGQSTNWTLQPSLYRLLARGFNEIEGDCRSIYELEYDLYFDFACRAPGMQDPSLSSWDKLAHMRHHGLPTRLLDWTERLGVAVYFALGGHASQKADPPAIWILSPCRLNEMVLGDRDLYSPDYLGYDWQNDERWDYEDYLILAGGTFDWKGPVAIYPAQKNLRMRSQLGWFTIFGENTSPLERRYSPKKYTKLLQKIEIPPGAIPAAREFLIEAGVDEASVYPDIDGFCRYLKTHYGVPA